MNEAAIQPGSQFKTIDVLRTGMKYNFYNTTQMSVSLGIALKVKFDHSIFKLTFERNSLLTTSVKIRRHPS